MFENGVGPLLVALAIIGVVYVYSKKGKKRKRTGINRIEEKKFNEFVKRFAKNTSQLKVADIEGLLEVAEQEQCFRQFKAWILKQDISPGVRVRVEMIYSLYVNKLN